MTSPRLIRIKEGVSLDAWHQAQLLNQGSLYLLIHKSDQLRLVEAKSLVTGRLCTLAVEFIEESPHEAG